VSDFLAEPESYRQALAITNRRHDVIAVDLHDPLEADLQNVGLLAVEDPETGNLLWMDTSSRAWREGFHGRVQQLQTGKQRVFRQLAVDHIRIGTDEAYTTPLTRFFQTRARRIRHM
jgi:hypothetical protein